MTDRQFVRKHYPNATLDFMVRNGTGNRPPTYYRVLTENILNKPEIICKGGTRDEAWRNAKRCIKEKEL